MHVEPPWVNKLLFPPAIKDQRKEPPMIDRLAALVRRVAELRQAGLEACHYAEEFYLRRIGLSVAGKLYLLNLHGWPILSAILFQVKFLYSLLTLNATFISI
jgi:hypothetical protein